jgi:hypothetical protein
MPTGSACWPIQLDETMGSSIRNWALLARAALTLSPVRLAKSTADALGEVPIECVGSAEPEPWSKRRRKISSSLISDRVAFHRVIGSIKERRTRPE